MNTTSASRADGATPGPTVRILVWDAPVRVFHWLMVACFATAYLTAETERWRLLHVTAGYTMAGLVAFRLLWGLFGTRHARFASFVRGPQAVLRYLKSLVEGHPAPHVGHNPAGAVAILLPMVPARVKEWAYFGFFIDLITALYSFIAMGDPITQWWPMFLFIGVLVWAYRLHHRKLAEATK